MDIYNLTKVDTTMDGKRGVLLQGFNIIGKPRTRRCCLLSERPS